MDPIIVQFIVCIKTIKAIQTSVFPLGLGMQSIPFKEKRMGKLSNKSFIQRKRQTRDLWKQFNILSVVFFFFFDKRENLIETNKQTYEPKPIPDIQCGKTPVQTKSSSKSKQSLERRCKSPFKVLEMKLKPTNSKALVISEISYSRPSYSSLPYL